jgi:hypothetical protein
MDAYDSHAGSDVDPHGSDVVADSLQGSQDQNATEADSNDEGSQAQKFDGQQSDSDQHTPAQKSKRLRAVSPASEGRDEFGDGASDLESVLTERDELLGPVGASAASSDRALIGNLFRHGSRTMCCKMIMKERLLELWQNR